MTRQIIYATLLVAGSLLMVASVATAANKSDKPEAVAWRSPGKPQAPVRVTWELAEKPQVGVPLAIDVHVTPTAAVDSVSVVTRTDNTGLLFKTLDMEARFAKPARGQPLSRKLEVVPQGEGRFYVSVFITTQRGAQRMARVVMIPVQVGNVQQKLLPEGELKAGPDGRAIISLPAEESRR